MPKKKSVQEPEPPVVETKSRGLLWLVLLVCLHLVLAGTYWHYTNYGLSPDEFPHGRNVEVLATTGSYPVLRYGENELNEAHQPPLYYSLGVPFYFLGRALDLPEPSEAVRLLSMLLGALSILVAYKAVRLAFPEQEWLALGTSSFVALLPTHVMLSSSVSNDILTELVFGLGLLVCTLIITRGVTLRRTLALAGIIGMGLLTKTTCVLLFPMAGLTYYLAWRRGAKTGDSWLHGLGAVGGGLIIASWWLIRNQQLYGDPFAAAWFATVFEQSVSPRMMLSSGLPFSTFIKAALWTAWRSYWGVFGSMVVYMPQWTYVTLAVLTTAAAGGSLFGVRRLLRAGSPQVRSVLVLYGATIVLVILAFIQFNINWYQPQGRYLYPGLIPFSALWVLGAGQLLPRGMRGYGALVSAVVLVFAQAVALATCILTRMPTHL